jgi:AcrR family transcriptional regulator
MVQPGQCHPVRPLRRDAEQNRQRILRATAEVFTTRGLQASLDDVARHAGVGVGTVYRRFPDKDALVEALFEERLGQVAGLADKALAEPDSWTGLTWFLEHACELLSSDRGLREILMFATYGRDRVQAARTRMQPLVTALVERAQRTASCAPTCAPPTCCSSSSCSPRQPATPSRSALRCGGDTSPCSPTPCGPPAPARRRCRCPPWSRTRWPQSCARSRTAAADDS